MLYSVKSVLHDPFDYYDETDIEGRMFIRLSPATKLESILGELKPIPESFYDAKAQADLVMPIWNTTYLKLQDKDHLLECGLYDPSKT